MNNIEFLKSVLNRSSALTEKIFMTIIIMCSYGHSEMRTNPTSMRNMIVWIQMETSPLLFRYQRCLFSVHDDKYIKYSGLSQFIQFYIEIFLQTMNTTKNLLRQLISYTISLEMRHNQIQPFKHYMFCSECLWIRDLELRKTPCFILLLLLLWLHNLLFGKR